MHATNEDHNLSSAGPDCVTSQQAITNRHWAYLFVHVLLSTMAIGIVQYEPLNWPDVIYHFATPGIAAAFPLLLLGTFFTLASFVRRCRWRFYFWTADMCVSLTTLFLIFPVVC